MLISSAGQLGRGGNVTIDGADNNDDVVGGPLQNLPQDAVQEFQMATARYSAELGRSASSTINVVTRSGTNQLRGEGSIFFRDSALQGLPATFDRANPDPPFDRQQYAISGGGPIKEGVFWYGALEYRDQDGGIAGRHARSRHPHDHARLSPQRRSTICSRSAASTGRRTARTI